MKFQHIVTNLPNENEYPKLIRDKIPEIIAANDNRKAATRVLKSDDEYLTFLLKKIVEEAEELSKSTTDSNLLEEIADVYEVIDAVLELKDISHTDAVKIQDEKRAKRGGFKERLLMLNND